MDRVAWTCLFRLAPTLGTSSRQTPKITVLELSRLKNPLALSYPLFTPLSRHAPTSSPSTQRMRGHESKLKSTG
jgi:hypothetical protein